MCIRKHAYLKRILFIDGSNLFGGLSELLRPGEFIDFAALLAVMERDLGVDEVKLYGTYMRVDQGKNQAYRLRVMAQKRFFDSAKAVPKVSFHKGHFSGTGKEKGVDVHLAVDMAIGAARDEYDEAVLMTGDADLKYAAEKAVELGKIVHLAAVGSRFPFGIAPVADRCLVYDVRSFFQTQILPTYRSKPTRLLVRELLESVEIESV